MYLIDILLLVIIIGGTIYGSMKGIISQLSSLAAFVVGIIACRLFSGLASSILLGMMDPAEAATASSQLTCQVASYCLVFLIAYVAVRLIMRSFKSLAHKTLLLGPIDRMLGAVFCILKWATALSLALNVFAAVSPDSTLLHSSDPRGQQLVDITLGIAPWILGKL